ncbi:MAG: AarF/ABC1/UbiB kinase family protein [Myxococcales bacterium]|nr:AarF/ABC1/UbiB kinase family protein [Myxococcales bacterium]
MGKRDELERITSSWARRTLASGRVALKLGRAAARRAVQAVDRHGDEQLGEGLATELDAMKGLAMKVGQMASYLEGSLPPDAQRVLRRLQRGGEPLAFEAIQPVVEQALGQPLHELYDTFDPTPIASASIAQVHRATVRGQPVAVKVQYPEIARTFEVDLGHLRRMGALASLGSALSAEDVVEELRDRLREECDFEIEADHQERFARRWADEPWVHVPEVIRSHSATTVLTSSFAEGQGFYAFVDAADEAARNRAAEHLFVFSFRSIFAHRCMHGDPHPGNYLFPEARDQTVFLDFGCVRSFERPLVDAWKQLARVVLEGRRGDLAEAMMATGMVPDPDRYDFDHHWEVMQYLYEPFTQARFRYTHDYVRRSWSLLTWNNPNLRHTRMPGPWVLVQRLQWGLNSVLALLNAEADFGTLFRAALDHPERS